MSYGGTPYATGADGTLQVTVNNGQGITLNQAAQAVAVTTVLPQSTGSVSRTQVAGEMVPRLD